MKILIPFILLFCAAITAHADFFNQLKDSAKNETSSAQENALNAASDALGDETKTQLKQAAATQSLLASAVDRSKQLESMLSGNPELKKLLTNSMTSLAQQQDFIALQDINSLANAKLSDQQLGLVKSLRSDVEVLALKRNLPESGPVTTAATAIQSGDYTQAIAPLQQALQSGTLTDPQKQLVQSIISTHQPVKEAAEAETKPAE